MKIKKGDNVIMLNGKDKGKTGKVVALMPSENKLVVEGLNLIKRHLRPRQQGQKGQILSKESSISISRVAVVCKSCGKPTRIGFSGTGESKSRICKKCKGAIS